MANELGLRIQQLREQKNLSQEEFSKALGFTQKQVSYWENGKARPRSATIREIAKFFNVDVSEITKPTRRSTDVVAEPDALSSEYPIPVLGPIAATPGRIRDAIHPIRYISGTKEDVGCYACEISGDSMLPEYRHGEIVVWRPVNLHLTPDADEGSGYVPYEAVRGYNGKDCIILHNGESSLKRIRIERTQGIKYSVDILALNDFYPVIHVRMGDDFLIQGVVKRSGMLR
ncbi:MAG: XRE family transcriptional regulator [Sterolibacterium sp.]